MSFTFIQFLQLLLIFQTYFFGLFLVSQRKKKLSNTILSILLFEIGSHILSWFLVSKSILAVPITNFSWFFSFSYGGLLYLYAQSLTYKDFEMRKNDFSHAILPIGVVILIFAGVPFRELDLYYGMLLSLVVYLFLTFKTITHFHKVLLHTVSTNSKLKLNWFITLFSYFILALVIDIVRVLINGAGIADMYWEILVNLILITMVNTAIYNGLRYPDIFIGIDKEDETIAKLNEDRKPESLVENAVNSEIRTEIQVYIEQNKPYLNPALSLAELSAQLKIPARQVSQVINEQLNQNFSDFVNTYRIKEAQKRLENPKEAKETISEVMYEVGFNSKSAFNTAFKKKTGLSPSQYKTMFNSSRTEIDS